ncbi:hypothetical protein BB561_005711 [Smittium simulii]|uniref:Endonuclease/exonuclease/phosphatase domain-containing protein n=1 Tax=Smittium simulii TaxID=133385 RepID=A0A2T9Y8X8_9FUNG|nr:hypothetical protein BB561_005711 [Smittium simulii]
MRHSNTHSLQQNQLKITKKQPILTEQLTVITFKVRGIKGYQHEFNELMRARQHTVVAVQETLLNKRLPGYTVIESKSDQNLGGNGLLIALKNNSDFRIFKLKQHLNWMSATIVGKTTDSKETKIILVNLHLPSAGKLNLARCLVEKPSGSRYNGLNVGRMLDHILYRGMGERPKYCTVLHTVDLSDHLPIQAE